MTSAPDIVIVGSGMGGATLAAGLAPSGAQITILERGHRIPDDAPARDPWRIYTNSAFRSAETWLDENGNSFEPGNYYNVGGNSKLYGAVLIRYRAEDFAELEHFEGFSPAWPLSYEELAPWYDAAEKLYRVRGDATSDPTEPAHAGPYQFPPVPDEPAIRVARMRLEQAGVNPFCLPLGVDIDRWLSAGKTGWDGYPDLRCGKMDAETCGLEAALAHENVNLITGAEVTGLKVDPSTGKVDTVTYVKEGVETNLSSSIVAVCAGAVQSAALLLRSGIANSSDYVGRCFMNHNATAMIAIDPRYKNDSVYQKTFGLNDWYLADNDAGKPLGNVQLLGRVTPDILKIQVPQLPNFAARWISGHALDLYLISEDLPDPESRVVLKNGKIQLVWRRSNMEAHKKLVGKMKATLRKAGFPIVLSRLFDGRVPSHQCGTVRMGADPQNSVLDPDCRSWDHPNLFVTDAAALPTSAAVNPALTVAALSLRTAETIRRELAA
ncbi:GMC oxidoreductase [Roseibium album]|uniref:6'''-hydroxyparomomycin C oxidase n=1 Tax=Roseibium album TaxID=311410 RepID=A0A0M6Z3E0_9HYPH|nr:GMC family oxidoreductase [Roseibium album]CTQ57258.1 6'''-hydroxyparomomycin C oxidase [Roseibium album]CTQ70031.1 6'''-hydroxyparomomycin C oxidase [Roseibium album]CTQ72000.1 6'''-hydroxyparomomycin C oxidase [Roseibium album]